MTTTTQDYKIITARYNGPCKRCQGPIVAGQLIQFFYEDKSTCHALPGECLGPVEKVEAKAPITTPRSIRDGYYTVVIEGNGHRTFRLRTNDADADFAPGKQVIGFLSGSNNEADYTGFGFVVDGQVIPWKRFRTGYEIILAAARFLVSGDHEAAGRMYAQASGNCYACNRTLTTPESIAAGIGPTCASRRA